MRARAWSRHEAGCGVDHPLFDLVPADRWAAHHPGEPVRKGQKVAVIEAMKMEHALTAAVDGTVNEVRASAGDQVAEGALVLTIDVGV